MKTHYEQYEIVISDDDLAKNITVEDIISYMRVKYQGKEVEIHEA